MGVLYYIRGASRQIAHEEDPVCIADTFLLVLVVISFTTYSLGEIYETLAMFHWLFNQLVVRDHQMLSMDGDDDKGDEDSDDDDFKLLGLGDDPHINNSGISVGMTRGYKIWCCMSLVFPKLAVGLLVLWYGNVFLFISANNLDVVLHAMSMKLLTKVKTCCIALHYVRVYAAIHTCSNAMNYSKDKNFLIQECLSFHISLTL